MAKVTFNFSLPDWLYNILRSVKRSLAPSKSPVINLWGDRDIEYSFIASRLPQGPGEALDFGSAFANLSLHAIQHGWNVTGVDTLSHPIYWKHPNFRFIQGDFLQIEFPPASFDLILNCSAVEHVGLPGRYGIDTLEADGDVAAMKKMLALLKTGGLMLLTIPAGRDVVVAPFHRVYGAVRLPRLLQGFEIVEQLFWVKDGENCWVLANRETALTFVPTGDVSDPTHCSYALACFILKKPAGQS